MDVLLGTWASINVNSLTLDELNQFEDFVNLFAGPCRKTFEKHKGEEDLSSDTAKERR